ncbi:AAA family ATPase [Psychrobacter alimentarius]|uniref:AAA family ATPase n=1 Tax=Psychrobacter alimentarius TaxID=261164 RepID=UPI003FD0613F
MRLIELRLKNLNSLKGEWHIDFADTAFTNEGIFAITGQTGAGKTTILDAICLALYGETPRINSISKSSNEVMTRQTAECFAEVVIDLNGSLYRCRWGQRRAYNKADGNLQDATHEIAKVYKDESKEDELLESTLKHTKNKITELTRMDFQQFTRSILLAQGSFSAFLKAKADERADILEKITGTDIYATISAHVHDKKRTEEDMLHKLQYGLEGLALLDTEEENQLKADLQSHQNAQSEQQQTIQDLSNKIQWLDSVTESKEKLRTYQHNLAQAQQMQQDFLADAKRLTAANKALEIDSQFGQLVYNRDNLKRLQDEQQQISDAKPRQEQDLAQATTNLEITQVQVQTTSNALRDTLPDIAKARQLDTDIAQNQHALKETKQRQQALSISTEHLRQEIDDHKKSAEQNKTQSAEVARYLTNNSELNNIESDIGNFERHCSRLKALLQDNADLIINKTSQQSDIDQHHSSLKTFHQHQETQVIEEKALQAQITALQQEQAALTEVQSLSEMRDEQEQIDDLNRQLEQIGLKAYKLNEISAQTKGIDTALPVLQNELTKLADIIDDTESTIHSAKDKRQDKQKQLYLLQKVATLENHIAELKQGHPCPLCGSLEHPYGANHPHFVSDTETDQIQQHITELDTTISDLENTLSAHRISQATKQHQLEQQQDQKNLLQDQARKLAIDIKLSVSLMLDKNYSPFIAETIQILQPLETQLAILPLLESTKHQLAERKVSLKDTLSNYETLAEKLTTIRDDISVLTQQKHKLTSHLNEIETNIKVKSAGIENIDNSIQDNFSELTTLKDDIVQLLTKYAAGTFQTEALTQIRASQHTLQALTDSIDNHTVLNDVDYQAHIHTLRQQRAALITIKNEFNHYKEAQQTLTTALGRLEIQIDTKQTQLDKNQHELDQLIQLVTEKTQVFEQLQKNRASVFADKDPDAEEKRFREGLEQAQTKKISAQRQLDNTEHTLNQLLNKQKSLCEQITTVTETLSTQETIFLSALSASDFVDEADFTAARLPLDERNALGQQQQHIDYALKQAQNSLEETQKTLAAKQASPLTTEDKEILVQRKVQAQDEFNKRMELVGAISQRLKDNEDKKDTQQAQMDAINAQKEKLQVWQQLHKLIGSSDGKRYRTFAQGLTFDIMISHANTKLQKMSNRYLLVRDDDNPLELNVMDDYQGGEIRSTKNLSGGEGFIISLALALGLSQMASQNIRVDSLFLDEGFGTLDEESLDIALDTLTSLQQEGKLIGVISHVQALKERILTQIKVEKLSGGFSQITGQGCRRVAR